MNKLLSAVSTTALLFALTSNAIAQDTATEVAEEAKVVAEEAVQAVTDEVAEVVESAEGAVEAATEGATETAEEVAEDVANAVEDTAEAAEEAVEATTEVAEEGAEVAVEATEEVAAPVEADLNQVVAKGEGFEIYLGDVLALKNELPPEYAAQNAEQLFPELVNQLVSQAIIAQEADTSTEVFKFKERQAERAIAVNQVLESYIEESLTDEYLQKTYDDAVGNQPAVEEFNASHILLETAEDAQAVIDEINNGADFAEVAKEKSTGPSGPEGGDLGWFGPGQMVPEFEEAVAELEVGAVTAEPVQTQFGFHVIKLNEKREQAKPTREELEPQLREYATQILMEEKVSSARDGVDVEITEDINPAVLNAKF